MVEAVLKGGESILKPIIKMVNENFDMKTYTKLMESLNVSETEHNIPSVFSSVEGTNEICVVSDKDGCDLVFVNDTGNGVIAYYIGDDISTFDGAYIPIYGDQLCAGIAPDGCAFAFVLSKNEVYFSKELSPHSGVFTNAQLLSVTKPRDFKRIEKITVKAIEEGFAFFAISSIHKDNSAYVTCRISDENYDYLLPVAFDMGVFNFIGGKREELEILQIGSTVQRCSLSDKKLHLFSLDTQGQGLVKDSRYCNGDIICITNQGNAGILILDNQEVYNFNKIVDSGNYRSASIRKLGNDIHFSFLWENKQVVHARAQQKGSGFIADTPFPIDIDTNAIAYASYEKEMTLYYYKRYKNMLVKLDYSEKSASWKETEIEVLQPGDVRRLPCYSTEVTFTHHEYKTPLSGICVEIWTEECSYIETLNGIKMCDKEHKIQLTTKMDGRINFIQYTHKIDVPVIYASLPENLLATGELLAFKQYEIVSEKMQNITSDTVYNAKTTDPMGTGQEDLLKDEFKTRENAEAIAQSVNELMKSYNTMNTSSCCKGVYLIHKDEIAYLNKLDKVNELASWSLTVEGNRIIYKQLTSEEAEQEKELMHVNAVQTNGLFSAIGDFFRAIGKAIVKVVKIVVNGLKAAIEFVINGVKMVFDAIASTISDILGFIETIFATVAVFFVAIFTWVASVFQWHDVKLAKAAIAGCLNVTFTKLPDRAQEYKNSINQLFKKLEITIDECIDQICEKIAPGESILAYSNKNMPEDAASEEAMSNNYLQNKLSTIDTSAVNILSSEETALYKNRLFSVMDTMEQYMKSISQEDGFKSAMLYLENAFNSIDSFFTNLFAALLQALKGLIGILLHTMEVVVTAIFDAFKLLFEIISEIMQKKINVPFFSGLYRFMTGDELTIVNLVSFVLSVPMVIMSKLITGNAPFKNEEAVEGFISDCTTIFSSSSLGQTTYRYSYASRMAAAIISLLAGTAYNGISAWPDFETCTTPPSPIPIDAGIIGWILWLLELTWFTASAPEWSSQDADPPYSEWAFAQCMTFLLGVLIDGVYVAYSGHIDSSGNVGRSITCVYGVFHMTMAGIVTNKESTAPEDCIPEFFGATTEMSKILINFDKTRTWSKWPVCLLDGVTATVVTICGSVSASRTDKDDMEMGQRIQLSY